MDTLPNLAKKQDCDVQIERELKESGINYQDRVVKSRGEVASTETTPLLFKFADDLHSKHGKYVRVAGHCCCPSPREWFNNIWDIGVNNYHIDTQEGLNAFVEYIEDQTTSC